MYVQQKGGFSKSTPRDPGPAAATLTHTPTLPGSRRSSLDGRCGQLRGRTDTSHEHRSFGASEYRTSATEGGTGTLGCHIFRGALVKFPRCLSTRPEDAFHFPPRCPHLVAALKHTVARCPSVWVPLSRGALRVTRRRWRSSGSAKQTYRPLNSSNSSQVHRAESVGRLNHC